MSKSRTGRLSADLPKVNGAPPPAPWLDEGIRVPPIEEEWRLKNIRHVPPFRSHIVDDGLG